MSERRERGFSTRLVHGEGDRDPSTGAIAVPIYQVSTFDWPDLEHPGAYDYARSNNPTRRALELAIADLERGHRGFAFASGMAATSAVLSTFSQGDHLVVSEHVYGGTERVVTRVFSRFGIQATFVDADRPVGGAGGGQAEHPGALPRDALQPVPVHHRPPRRRGVCPRAGPPDDRRQHLHDSLPPAAARAWLRRGHPFGDQVPRRAQRRDRRPRRGEGPGGRPGDPVPPERARRGAGSPGLVPGASGPEDARRQARARAGDGDAGRRMADGIGPRSSRSTTPGLAESPRSGDPLRPGVGSRRRALVPRSRLPRSPTGSTPAGSSQRSR